MKNILLIIALVTSTLVSGQNLYKGLEVGMTKKEAKSEFKKNKEQYISATLGSYKYRHYTQNNSYEDGGLIMIAFSPKGFGLGMDRVNAKLYFLDMIRLLDNTGFVVDEINIKAGNYREFAVGGTYAFHNKETEKTVYLGIPVYMGESVLFNVVIGKYAAEGKKDYNKDNSFN